MGDDSGLPLEPLEPLIDVRSPGERWAESGRAWLERLKGRVEQQRLDIAALLWMVFVLAIAGSDIYSTLRFGSFRGYPGINDWWYKLQVLAQSGGGIVVFGGAIGIALAVLLEGPTSRLALRLSALGGAWAVVASACGVAVAFHTEHDLSPLPSFEGRVIQAIYYLGYAGLGVLIVMIGWRFSRQLDEL